MPRIPPIITEDTYKSLVDSYQGICTSCLSTKDSCEPDAERYQCDNCDKHQVYGTEQLLIMGLLQITPDQAKENIKW